MAFGVGFWDFGDVPRSPPEARCPRGQGCASLPRAIPAVSHGTAPTRCLAAAPCSVAVSSSQLHEPLFSSEGNQYFSKFSALDPALDFCLASGEAGVFAKLLGCPAPYQGSDPSVACRGSVWLYAAPHLLMGSLCPSVISHLLCTNPCPSL